MKRASLPIIGLVIGLIGAAMMGALTSSVWAGQHGGTGQGTQAEGGSPSVTTSSQRIEFTTYYPNPAVANPGDNPLFSTVRVWKANEAPNAPTTPGIALIQNRLGIGTKTPQYALTVDEPPVGLPGAGIAGVVMRGEDNAVVISTRSDGTEGMRRPPLDIPFVLDVRNKDTGADPGSGTSLFLVRADGNVGIGTGTTAPANRLHVVLDDGTSDNVMDVLRVGHTTTDSKPKAGLGASLVFAGEDGNGDPQVIGSLYGILTDVTDGSEKGALAFNVNSGIDRNEVMRITNTGIELRAHSTSTSGENKKHFLIQNVNPESAPRGVITMNRLHIGPLNDDGSAGNPPIMTFLPNGSVGIGTITPNTALDINGALTMRGINTRNDQGDLVPGAIPAPPVPDLSEGRIYFDDNKGYFKMAERRSRTQDSLGRVEGVGIYRRAFGFPPPDYDSASDRRASPLGWVFIKKGETLQFDHNLDTLEYMVYLEFKHAPNPGRISIGDDIHNRYIGGEQADGGGYHGVFWSDKLLNSIKVTRAGDEGYSNEVRLRLWRFDGR